MYLDNLKVRRCNLFGVRLYQISESKDRDEMTNYILECVNDISLTPCGITKKSRRHTI